MIKLLDALATPGLFKNSTFNLATAFLTKGFEPVLINFAKSFRLVIALPASSRIEVLLRISSTVPLPVQSIIFCRILDSIRLLLLITEKFSVNVFSVS
jgi:hypothetical protein